MIRSLRFQKTFNVAKAQLIGEGNFAKVYRVFDESLGKYIAIRKVIKSKEDIVDIEKQREINEQLKKCSSPYILDIYQIIDGEDCLYYLTEYCQGESLWHALNSTKNHKFTEEQTLKCILHIARGVQQLHNQRITHRDLKPENILLTNKYVKGKEVPDLKIADFGLSTKNIIMETVAGTKEYIAPEQAKFNTYTNAVDVWSLGIIFDELLHGQPFYTGADNKEVFDKVIKIEYSVRNPNISKPIQDLLLKIVRKKAYQRPIIAAIISDIEEILKIKQTSKEEGRPKSQSNIRTLDKYVVENKQNKFGRISRDSAQHQTREDKIPLFKMEKKKAQNQNKKKRQNISKEYLNADEFVDSIYKQQEELRSSKLKSKPFQFNPNLKLSSIQVANSHFPLFVDQKKKFQYLNEIWHDESYEIKLSTTKQTIQQSKLHLEAKRKQIQKELKSQVLNQIDLYVEDLIARCLQ